jgi:hypothetical protein
LPQFRHPHDLVAVADAPRDALPVGSHSLSPFAARQIDDVPCQPSRHWILRPARLDEAFANGTLLDDPSDPRFEAFVEVADRVPKTFASTQGYKGQGLATAITHPFISQKV